MSLSRATDIASQNSIVKLDIVAGSIFYSRGRIPPTPPHLPRPAKARLADKRSTSTPSRAFPTEYKKTAQETDTPTKDSITQSFPISTATATPSPPSTSPSPTSPEPNCTITSLHLRPPSNHPLARNIYPPTRHLKVDDARGGSISSLPYLSFPGHRQSEFRLVYDGDNRGLSPQKIGLTVHRRKAGGGVETVGLVSLKRIRTCMRWLLSTHFSPM